MKVHIVRVRGEIKERLSVMTNNTLKRLVGQYGKSMTVQTVIWL